MRDLIINILAFIIIYFIISNKNSIQLCLKNCVIKFIDWRIKASVKHFVKKAEKKYSGEKLGKLKKEYVTKKTEKLKKHETKICNSIDNIIENFVAYLNTKNKVVKNNITTSASSLANEKIESVSEKIEAKLNNTESEE